MNQPEEPKADEDSSLPRPNEAPTSDIIDEEPNPDSEPNPLAEEYGLSPEQTKMFSMYL